MKEIELDLSRFNKAIVILVFYIERANGQSLMPNTMMDNINDITDLETTTDDVAIFPSDDESIVQINNESVVDVNEQDTNMDERTSTSSEDESLSTQVCVPVNYQTNEFNLTPNIDHALEHMDQLDSSNNLDKMRQYLETQCYEGSKWYHSLTFEGTKDKRTFSNIDILQYVGNSYYKDKKEQKPYRIYFNPETYPVNDELSILSQTPDDATIKQQTQQRFKSSSYLKLSKDIRKACGHCGFNIIQNGNQKFNLKKSGLIVRSRFSCQKYMVHKGFARNITGDHDFRRYTLHNDRKNQRTLGRKKCRRSYSSRSTTKATRCKFFFYLDFDEYGFYVVPGLGTRHHSHHSPLNRAGGETTHNELQEKEHGLITDMAEGQAPDAQIQNTVFNKTGKLVPRHTIRQITKYNKRAIVNDSDFSGMFENKEVDKLSSSEYMMKYCRSKNYNFQLLLNDPLFSSEKPPTSETYLNDQEEPKIESVLDFNEKEMDSLKNNIDYGRIAMNLQQEQKYMMSFAWVNPKELSILDAFPEFIMIDTTEKTNNEKRPLLTAGAKDSNGNMFIFLRVFMPNQQSWMFRWVFSVVFPRLIPKHIQKYE